MSKEDKDKVQILRKSSSDEKARSVKSATSDVPEEEHQNDAGNQFGRNSHKKGKKE